MAYPAGPLSYRCRGPLRIVLPSDFWHVLLEQDKISGETRETRSLRREAQAAARQQDQANAPSEAGQHQQTAEESLSPTERDELQKELAYKRQLLFVDRFDERNRGLAWLALAAVTMLWLAGAFEPSGFIF